MGWAIVGVCAAAVLYLWYQYDRKEREFQKWLDEVKRRSGEASREPKRNGED